MLKWNIIKRITIWLHDWVLKMTEYIRNLENHGTRITKLHWRISDTGYSCYAAQQKLNATYDHLGHLKQVSI